MSDKATNDQGQGKHGFDMAGAMAAAFIHSPLSPLLLVASIAVGILGLMMTPRQEDPQISVPMVDIFVSYPGASAEQVASLVASPLERIMSEIPGVEHVYSASHRDHAMVTVQFEVGEQMESSLVKLYDKLASNRDRIPPGVSEPLVKPKGVDDVPVVTVTLWSHELDDAMLRQIGLEALQRVNEVPNTSQSFIVSGREEQMRIELLPERMMGFNITTDQIANAVRAANSERGVGRIEAEGQTFSVYTGAFLRHAGDLERLLVAVHNGRPVYLRDVARISHGPGETQRMVKYYPGVAGNLGLEVDGAQAVTLAVAKKVGSNGVTVANGVLAQIEQLRGVVIPDNVNVAITRNYGETANDKVNELIFKLFIATGAVTLLVWLFLGVRAAGVVLVVIPVVILFTVFSAWVLGYTIDRVSLFALIFAIGILVDDAIVVVENIYRRWLIKKDIDTETTIDAVREVGNPTILATFTVIAALLPMGFVSGMMGPYMEPIPALGSVAMLFSLVAAFLFTPWLTMRLRPSMASLAKAAEKEHRQSEQLGRLFRRMIPGLAENRLRGWGFLLAIIALFFISASLFYTTDVRVKMLPLDNKPEFNVVINFPAGTALPVTANLTHDLAERLRQIPEVTAVQTYVGTASPFNFNGLVRHYYLRQEPWQADIQVQLQHKRDRRRSSHEIAVQVREQLAPIARAAGARIQVVEMPPGPPVLQSVVAEIYGPDAETRRQFARDMMAMFEQAEHLDDVDSYLQEPHQVWHFEVDRDKALRLGITVDAINRTLEYALGGATLGSIKPISMVEPTLIVMQVPLELRANLDQLTILPVASMFGGSVALGELGQFQRRWQDDPIYHKDLRPVEFVTAETVGRLAAPIYGMLEVQRLLDDYTAPDGVQPTAHWIAPPPGDSQSAFEWSGEWTVTYETFRDMGIAFAIALVLIYMLVVWEFGNFVLPAIVMAPIPLTLIGIIPGHWLFNAEFTATSMIGFIALAGIIVRNSILLVDFSRQAMDQGAGIMDALVEACQARTRPIIITALALVAGSSVILFDPIFQGMAISLMFGTVVSTLLTLLVIPLGCISGRRAFCPASLSGSGALVCDDGHGNGHGHAAGRSADMRGAVGVGRRPGPISTALGYAGLYLQALALSLLEGLVDLYKAALKLVRRLLQRRRSAPLPPPPAAPTPPSPPPVTEPGAETPAVERPVTSDTEKPQKTGSATARKAVHNEASGAARPASKKADAADGEETVDKPVVKRVRKTAAKPRARTGATEEGKETAKKGARTSGSRASKSKSKADEGEGKVAAKATSAKPRATASGRTARTRRGIRLKSTEQATDSKKDEGKE